jgi:pimeloyl-ACP methyl ester carboxylesterase
MDQQRRETQPGPPPVTRYLARPEGRIGYDVSGDGEHLVLCLPGMGQLRSSYRLTRPALLDAGFRVASMDLRGHGDSDTGFSSYDDVAAGTDALALLDHLGTSAILVGNSMSAGAAVWAAAERPELVDGLVLIGPFVRQVPMNPLLGLVFRLAMSGPWARRVWISYLPKLSPGKRSEDYQQHLELIAASMARPGRSAAFTATTRTSHAPVEARLDEVHTPTLVIMGTHDPDFPDPSAEARYVAKRLDGHVLMVNDTGHYPHADDPETVNPRLVEFARGVAGDPGGRPRDESKRARGRP